VPPETVLGFPHKTKEPVWSYSYKLPNPAPQVKYQITVDVNLPYLPNLCKWPCTSKPFSLFGWLVRIVAGS